MKFIDDVLTQMGTLITSAFGLVAALAWNGAIQSLFKHIFGTADTLNAQLAYAITVTVIAVAATIWIARAVAHSKEKLKETNLLK
jgi:hypothetical protein